MAILPVQEEKTAIIFSEQQQASVAHKQWQWTDDFYSFAKSHTLEGSSKHHLVNPRSEA